MPVWHLEREKEHARLWKAITGQISPKVLTPAPELIALFWRWIKAFVLWLRKPKRSLPAGLNQHSISPQQCLPACLPDGLCFHGAAEPDRKQNAICTHSYSSAAGKLSTCRQKPAPQPHTQHSVCMPMYTQIRVNARNKRRPVICQTMGAITECTVCMEVCAWSGDLSEWACQRQVPIRECWWHCTRDLTVCHSEWSRCVILIVTLGGNRAAGFYSIWE